MGIGGRGGGSGGAGPGPGTGVTTPQRLSKKKHIKKPQDFTDTKDWDNFKQHEFLYYEEYEEDNMI